jgi:hypothetical protein
MTLKNNPNFIISYSVTILQIQNSDGTFWVTPFINVIKHLNNKTEFLNLDSSLINYNDLDDVVSEIKGLINSDHKVSLKFFLENNNQNLNILWHNFYFIRDEYKNDWAKTLYKNGTLIYKKQFTQVQEVREYLKGQPKYSLLSIDKCVINLNSIENWENIVEETFNGESATMDLSLDNIKDDGDFIKYYAKLIHSYALDLN